MYKSNILWINWWAKDDRLGGCPVGYASLRVTQAVAGETGVPRDPYSKDHPRQARRGGTRQTARQRQSSLQDDGLSRDSFYRFKDLYETGGEMALLDMERRKPNPKNRVDPEINQAVVDIAVEQPTWGQARVANELRKRNLKVSPFGVRCIWQRHGLENMKND